MILLYACAVLLGLAIMGAGVFSLRERTQHARREAEVALAHWISSTGFNAEQLPTTTDSQVRRAYRGRLSNRIARLVDGGESSYLHISLRGAPRPVEMQVRAKWDGSEDTAPGRTSVTIPVPPYVQLWASAAAEDAGKLGKMLSPKCVQRLADAGEGVFVRLGPDGLLVGERRPLTAETAVRAVSLASDLVHLWSPVLVESTQASPRPAVEA